MIGLLLLAGWHSDDRLWVPVIVMIEPVMFLRGYHGGPWQWLLLSVRNPILAPGLMGNMLPIVAAYFALVALGRLARTNFVEQTAR